MVVTQRSKYALRAILELSVHFGEGPVSIGEIAKAQLIPARFLEAILAQLKRAKLVDSKRGNEGGYLLSRPPSLVSVGDVLRVVQGTLTEAEVSNPDGDNGLSASYAVFRPIWQAAGGSANSVYDAANFQILVDRYRMALGNGAPDYAI